MTTHYKYENGIFTEDKDNYTKIGKTAFTVYTGGVLILDDCYFDKQKKRYFGQNRKTVQVELKPSQILEMKCLAQKGGIPMNIKKLLIKLVKFYLELEELWMSELYFEQREYDKAHLLFPKK